MPPKSGDRVKRAHKVLNLQEKLDLIKLSEQGMSHADIGRKLGVPRSSVSSILKVKDKVLDEIKKATPMHTKHIRKRDSLIAEMEKVLNTWIQDQVSYDIPVSTAIIQAKALDLFHAMKAEREAPSKEETFVASKGWFDRFKARSRLHNIAVQGGASSADTAAAYDSQLENMMQGGGYTKQQIFSADETDLFWKKMLPRTCIAKEEKSTPEHTTEPRLMTCEELEEGIAMQEKMFAYWEKVDPNFERSEKVISMQEDSIACYRELLKQRKKALSKQPSILSVVKTPPRQPSTGISEPSTSTRLRSTSKSPSPKKRKRKMCKVSDDEEICDDVDELIHVSFLA